MNQATYHGSRASLMEKLRELPALLAGKSADPAKDRDRLMGALGLQALTLIKDAYVTKSRGGTDEAGIHWEPLSPRYVAYGRRHPGLARKRTLAAKAGRARRPLLTKAQDELWRRIYVRNLRRMQKQGKSKAEGIAAAIAWATVKRAGGKTILAEYGKTHVEILRDTGRLLNSLSPGSSPAPTSSDQIFRVEAGAIVVGTNVYYASFVHKKRPLWPNDPNGIPASWWARLGDTLSDGLAMLLQRKLG